MSLTWNQFVHAPVRSLPRSALVVPLMASLLVHAMLLFAILCLRWDPFARPVRLTDAPPQTVLTLAPPQPAPVAAPVPPPPPPPEPVKTPEPEPVAKAAPDELAPPAPKVEEAPAAPPEPVTIHVQAPAPPPAPAAPVLAESAPVSFAGVEAARARRVVYVVDASGAMTSSLRFVKEELARSISRLDSSQSFQVVVFRELPGAKEDAAGFELPPSSDGKLMAVTNESRVSSAAWLSGVQPGGRSDPLTGLTAALKMKPDLIFLLTRSIRRSGATTEWGAGSAATLNALDKLNPVGSNGLRPTVIKAIQFLDEDPTGLLQQIGDLHGDGEGSYKVLKLQEVVK